MFLQPHHFQQEARHVERLVRAQATAAAPHAWGFTQLEVDESALALGKVVLVRAQGVLPDGTPIAMPQWDPLPLAFDVGLDCKNELIVLALPLQSEGVDEVVYDDAKDLGSMHRHRAHAQPLRDSMRNADEPELIETCELQARLMRLKDVTDGHAVLGVAWVSERRSDGSVVLDREYLPPMSAIGATAQLPSGVTLIHGLMKQRGHDLAARMGQLGHGVSELADFLLLQTINRHQGVVAEHVHASVAHPRELHRDLLALAGDLATLCQPDRRAVVMPAYRHDDLRGCFEPLFMALRGMLSTVIDARAVQIELTDRKHGVRTAVFKDLALARSATLVLAVNAQMPAEALRQHFPAQTKVGSVDKLRDLVNLQLPGIGLRSLPVAPRQLPYHAGHHYFELERTHDAAQPVAPSASQSAAQSMWRAIEASGNLAMHVSGDFPGMTLELWAIRSDRA
jgi:type VI secretion system protein ImpJ